VDFLDKNGSNIKREVERKIENAFQRKTSADVRERP